MSNWLKTLIAAATLVLCASCGAAGLESPESEGPALAPLHGSSMEGVELREGTSSIEISIASVPAEGAFYRLSLPAGIAAATAEWRGAGHTVPLLVPTANGADIGVAPTQGYSGSAVTVHVELVDGDRTASTPPTGQHNVISDLAVTDAGGGQVQLAWTQINTGDYDFNGEVNIADITPLAGHLGETYDRAAAGASELHLYWIDGDRNGEVNVGDLTPIGQNYGAFIGGYLVSRNGTEIPGSQPLDPTVPRSQGTTRPGLPPQYFLQLPGLTTDAWVVASVDAQGNRGAGTDGGGPTGPSDLNTSLTISGPDLLELDGTGSGQFGDGSGKFSSRVIDPVDIVSRTQVGTAARVSANTTAYFNLPRARRLVVDYLYAPTVNLATGGVKGGASLRSASVLPADDMVISSVSFPLPAGDDPVDIVSNIELAENPDGGYFVYIESTITVPGDDPTTLTVTELSYVIDDHRRLAYASGVVSQDTDLNGDYSDEATLLDDDLDCLSGSCLDEDRYRDGYEDDDEHEEIEFDQADVLEFSEAEGRVVIDGTFSTPFGTVSGPLTILFSERTEFEYENGGGHDPNIDPSVIQVGDVLKIELFTFQDPTVPGAELWAEKIQLLGPNEIEGGGGGGGGSDDD